MLSDALRGDASADAARKAFIASAAEEGVLIERERVPLAQSRRRFGRHSRATLRAIAPGRPEHHCGTLRRQLCYVKSNRDWLGLFNNSPV